MSFDYAGGVSMQRCSLLVSVSGSEQMFATNASVV